MKISKEIINLIYGGESINKISKITGIGKSTIYYHYKKIRGVKIKKIKINFKNENELGEFLGIFAGDGSFYMGKNSHYKIRVYIGYYEKEYLNCLYKKFILWFNKKPHIYYTRFKNKISMGILHYDSKDIYCLLKNYLTWNGKKTYTIKLKEFNLNKKEFNLGFLRGLIDTDGSYYKPKKRLSFSTTSKELSNQVYDIFKYNLNINPHLGIYKKLNRADLYTLSLHGQNAIKTINLIKPNNPNKIMR